MCTSVTNVEFCKIKAVKELAQLKLKDVNAMHFIHWNAQQQEYTYVQ